MFKKSLIFLLIFLFFISFSLNVNAVSEDILHFIEEWNSSVETLANQWAETSERNQDLAEKLYLTEELLYNSIDSNDYFLIDFFDNPEITVELEIRYRDAEQAFYITVWNIQEDRALFLKTNYEAAHIGEVLIHTVEDEDNAARIVNELGIYDFWSYQGLENIAAYHDLEIDQDGAFYFMNLDDFYIGFDVFDGSLPDGYDISYSGSWR